MKKFVKRVFNFVARISGIIPFGLYFRYRFYHEETKNKSKPLRGKAIVIANHQSIIDYFSILFTFPFRKQRFLVSELLHKNKFVGFLSNMMDDIIVHRERSDLSFMAEAENTLNKNGVVTIFPEGHLNKEKDLDVFKPSVVYLALRTGAPIVPCYIDAHYNSIQRTRIIIGKEIYLKDYCDKENPSIEEVKKLCEMLRSKVNDLKRTLKLYRKHHTRDVIYPKSWFLDLSKALLWLPTKFVFPTKFHYVGGATRKDRRIKDRAIVLSKHSSFIDPPILQMHYFSRRLHTIVAEDAANKAPWLLDHLMTITYRRQHGVSDPKCFMEAINILKANGVVGLYPEGQVEKDGEGTIHSGAAYFSLVTNSPIYTYWQMRSFKFFRFNHIMIGKPIYPSDYFTLEEMKDRSNVDKLTAIISEQINTLILEGKKYKK